MKKLLKRDMVFTITVIILIGFNIYYYIVPDVRSNLLLTFTIFILITTIIRIYILVDNNIKALKRITELMNKLK